MTSLKTLTSTDQSKRRFWNSQAASLCLQTNGDVNDTKFTYVFQRLPWPRKIAWDTDKWHVFTHHTHSIDCSAVFTAFRITSYILAWKWELKKYTKNHLWFAKKRKKIHSVINGEAVKYLDILLSREGNGNTDETASIWADPTNLPELRNGRITTSKSFSWMSEFPLVKLVSCCQGSWNFNQNVWNHSIFHSVNKLFCDFHVLGLELGYRYFISQNEKSGSYL